MSFWKAFLASFVAFWLICGLITHAAMYNIQAKGGVKENELPSIVWVISGPLGLGTVVGIMAEKTGYKLD